MGQNSAIEWTHHTFNPWWGCVRVSPGCEACYAETFAHRYGHDIWGPAKTTQRREMSESYWKQPLKWNRDAEKAGQRARVFCASMADVFEDHPQVVEWRERLWWLIGLTPRLDWLILTKRPENIARMMPVRWGCDPARGRFDDSSLMPPNVWIGTSVENQEYADKRIPELLKVPARIRFLSCEPLIGPVDLSAYLAACDWCGGSLYGEHECYDPTGIDWVIVGGESGHGARPMHPDWARSLRDQAQAAGVAYFFKQHGEYIHETQIWRDPMAPDSPVIWSDAYTALMLGKKEPADRGWQHEDRSISYRVGKKAAGRLLDGRAWDEFPNAVDTSGARVYTPNSSEQFERG